jgi:hypothetical protein
MKDAIGVGLKVFFLFVFFFVVLLLGLVLFLGFVMMLRFLVGDHNILLVMIAVAILVYATIALTVIAYMIYNKKPATLTSES